MAIGMSSISRRPRTPATNSGPMQGLQAARPATFGGRSPMSGPYGQHGQQVNQNIMNATRPTLNPMGGRTYTNQPQAVGQTGFGQNIYGWINGQPVLTPTLQSVQYMPGAGPDNAGPGGGGGGGNGAGNNMGGLIGPFTPMPRIPEMTPVDDSEAAREAYARAKDIAGQQGRAALDSLMDIQGARGIVGSGIGINEAGGVIAEGARQLGDFNREQAIQRVENERRRREINYQGNINQRGQDYSGRGLEFDRLRWNAQRSPSGTYQYPQY